MKLKNLKLVNFRNFEQIQVDISSDLVLVLGSNTSGKTNFIEAIYYLSFLESFRAPLLALIKKDSDHLIIEAQVENSLYRVAVQANKRRLSINGAALNRSMWAGFPLVLFSSQDLNLFVLGPSLRRRFLDETLSVYKKSYAADLMLLDHALKQRVALLKQINLAQASIDALSFWDEQLAEIGIRVTHERKAFLQLLNERFAHKYKKITEFKNNFEIKYLPSVLLEDKQSFLNQLYNKRSEEIRLAQNLVGPHRDDFSIIKDGQINISNSSGGEMRAQILALKFLQAEFLTEHKKKPLILLDDVFSELDEVRRKNLLDFFSDYQIFITTTEEHHLPHIQKKPQIIKVKAGEIEIDAS